MGQYICDHMVTTHNNSLDNLIRGVGERVLYTDRACTPCVKPKPGIFVNRCASYMRTVASYIGRQSPVSRQEFVNYYKGPRRALYQVAADGLVSKPIRPRDAYLSTFIKAEKVNLSVKPDPAPRVIQPRKPRFNVELGKYLLPLEHKVYDAIDKLFKSPTVMSKYNSFEQAAILKAKWDKFKDPVCVGMDASRFDQHVSRQALMFEHWFYKTVFGRDKFLSMLLKWQITNIGYAVAADGWFKYTKVGSRMSGDMNTSLGNKFLMCLMAFAFVSSKPVEIEFVNNGDDCLLILEKKHLKTLNNLEHYFKKFGFKIVREAPVYEFEHIEFCQCKPIYCNGIYRMIRNVKTCLLKDVTSVNLGHDVEAFQRWLNDVANCGLSFAADIPVLGSYYRMLQRFGRKGKLLRSRGLFDCYGTLSRNAHIDFDQPDDAGRYSFWKQTGISPDAQLELEKYFDNSVWGGDKRQFIENYHTLIVHGS